MSSPDPDPPVHAFLVAVEAAQTARKDRKNWRRSASVTPKEVPKAEERYAKACEAVRAALAAVLVSSG